MVIVVRWLCAASTAAKSTQKAVAGYLRRNASGAVVIATTSSTQADGADAGAITTAWSGAWGTACTTSPWFCVITSTTETTVAATASATSNVHAARGRRLSAFTGPLSPAAGPGGHRPRGGEPYIPGMT